MLDCGSQTLHLCARMKCCIIADAGLLSGVALQPFFWREISNGDRRKDFHVDLLAHLQGVTPIDKDSCFFR